MYGSVLAAASTVHLKLRLAFIAFSPDCPDLPRPLDWRYAGLMICRENSSYLQLLVLNMLHLTWNLMKRTFSHDMMNIPRVVPNKFGDNCNSDLLEYYTFLNNPLVVGMLYFLQHTLFY